MKHFSFRSVPLRGSRSAALGAPLVTFVVKRKSPGCRAWQGHALAERPHIVGRRGPRPCKAPEGDRSPPSTYTPKRTKSCTPTCNRQGKNLPSAGKNLRCAVAETRIGRAIMAQKSEGIFPRFFAAYSKFSGAFDIPSRSRAPCCGCAWRSRLRRFPAG